MPVFQLGGGVRQSKHSRLSARLNELRGLRRSNFLPVRVSARFGRRPRALSGQRRGRMGRGLSLRLQSSSLVRQRLDAELLHRSERRSVPTAPVARWRNDRVNPVSGSLFNELSGITSAGKRRRARRSGSESSGCRMPESQLHRLRGLFRVSGDISGGRERSAAAATVIS